MCRDRPPARIHRRPALHGVAGAVPVVLGLEAGMHAEGFHRLRTGVTLSASTLERGSAAATDRRPA
jgi:hypothetical protein